MLEQTTNRYKEKTMEKMNQIRNERHCTLFMVPDGDSISIDGTLAQVEYIDGTHFYLIGSAGGKRCYHIDEFGDIFGRRNVQPVLDDGLECFKYHIDSEQGGWVEVPKSLLRELCLMDTDSAYRISHSSVQKGDIGYLEDSRDATLFRAFMENRGRKVRYAQVRVDGESLIRSYEYFKHYEADHDHA